MGRRVLIKNGHIVDPKQNFDQVMNLYIENGKIVNLTEEEPDADLVIDAAGKIVCPGFIDIHMHEDEYDPLTDTIETGMAESALRMGVTLDIGGNCGTNTYDPVRYLDLADRDGAPVNIGLMVGHTWLRNLDGKRDKYKPVSSEAIAEMEGTAPVSYTHLRAHET